MVENVRSFIWSWCTCILLDNPQSSAMPNGPKEVLLARFRGTKILWGRLSTYTYWKESFTIFICSWILNNNVRNNWERSGVDNSYGQKSTQCKIHNAQYPDQRGRGTAPLLLTAIDHMQRSMHTCDLLGVSYCLTFQSLLSRKMRTEPKRVCTTE